MDPHDTLPTLLEQAASPLPATVPSALRAHLAGLGAVTRFGALLLVFYSLFFNLSVVRGSSMTPGIQDGDRILVEPWSYLLGPVERGDVIVLRYPLDPEIDYIKRVIGLPGDQVTLARGEVWVNGVRLDEPYIAAVDVTSTLSTVVEPRNYFVLGDNRPRSSDSREFGLVPEANVRGRVDLRLWPLERAGLIQ
ncbi:MAG: signal peptidase I [Planctomycetes bacterium]|nr:signal peptidase I [Planctomycetota bacterium]